MEICPKCKEEGHEAEMVPIIDTRRCVRCMRNFKDGDVHGE